MIVGVLRLRVHIPAARSLKDRRAVVRRALDRVRSRYSVSAAEVGDVERWQVATLAVSVVTSDRSLANQLLDKVTGLVASAIAGAAEITGRETLYESYNDDEPIGDADWATRIEEERPHGDDEEA